MLNNKYPTNNQPTNETVLQRNSIRFVCVNARDEPSVGCHDGRVGGGSTRTMLHQHIQAPHH